MTKRTFLIAGSTAPIAKDPRYSHYSGPALILAHQLRSMGHRVELVTGSWLKPEGWLASATDIVLYHGLDMNGKLSINLYGGGTADNWKKLVNMAAYCSPLGTSLHSAFYQTPNYAAYCKARSWNPPPKRFSKGICILEALSRSAMITNPNPSSHLILGDSHAPSVWVPGAHLKVISGLTLHGALEKGIHNLIDLKPNDPSPDSWRNYKRLTLYLGNIDIRHHLCRITTSHQIQVNMIAEMGTRLLAQLEHLRAITHVREIELVEPLYIEPETRVIPKTGWHKGRPFWGTWTERCFVRVAWAMELVKIQKKLGCELYLHPKAWQDDGTMREEFLEKPRSVHVAPINYRAAKELFT